MVDPNPIITSVDPSAQVLDGIDSVLEAILEYCGDYTNSLTQEERSSFVSEYSRYFACVMSYHILHFNG
jgi:hypothetical protein